MAETLLDIVAGIDVDRSSNKIEKLYSFVSQLFYRLFLKHMEVILTVISDGRDMHTHKSDVRAFKSSKLHILVKLSALFSFWSMVSFNVEISENNIARCAVISQEKHVV